jgi:predicted DNA binding CopG/RHH family protein
MKIAYTTRLHKETIKNIKIKAAEMGVSTCSLIEKAIDLYLAKDRKEKNA